jgi:hypothetical protein
MYTPQRLRHDLLQGAVRVTFTKLDGTKRTMYCTLKEDLIPESHRPLGLGDVDEEADLIKVFDVQKDGWRSFHASHVLDVAA